MLRYILCLYQHVIERFLSFDDAKVDKLIIHANLLLDYLLKKVIFV